MSTFMTMIKDIVTVGGKRKCALACNRKVRLSRSMSMIININMNMTVGRDTSKVTLLPSPLQSTPRQITLRVS